MYKYYEQLKNLESYLKTNEYPIEIDFMWYDAFTGESGKGSINYEKACVLFNLAAHISNIAAGQNLLAEEGNKKAYLYCQVSAGIFKSIIDDYNIYQKDFPTEDVKEESIRCLNKLMLASAQECILNIKIMENVHCSKLYKIASYLSIIYEEIYKTMENSKFKFHFNSWKSIINLKSKYYTFISFYYKALTSDDEAKYGFVVSYLVLAEKNAMDTYKLAKSYLTEKNNQSVRYNKNIIQNILKNSKLCYDIIADMKKQVVRDNDEIYNEVIPDSRKIKILEKECLVKNLNFINIYPNGQKEIHNIVGRNIFRNLISIDE